MKSWLLLTVAFLLTAISFQVSHPELDFYTSDIDTIRSIPLWDMTPTQSHNGKNENKFFISQSSLTSTEIYPPQVVKHIDPDYYLPIFSLHREKVYFLLIKKIIS